MTPDHSVSLTHNVKIDGVAAHRLSANLALVDAGVSLLCPFDLQRPLVGLRMVIGLETLVARVRVAAHCEDVQVSVPDPGYLRNANANKGSVGAVGT